MEIIKLTQIPVINYQGIEETAKQVDERIRSLDLENQVATVDTVKSLKETRASLNKEFKEYEEQRKQIKNAIAKPYQAFEEAYKNLISSKFSNADNLLREKICKVEDDVKQGKEEELTSYFAEYCLSKQIDFVDFSKLGLKVTLTASEKSLKEKVRDFLDKISEDVEMINILPEDAEFKADVMAHYKRTLELNRSLSFVQEHRKAKALELERQEVSQEKASQEKVVQEKAEPKQEEQKKEVLKAPIVEEKKPELYEVKFSVSGTIEQLKALKTFLVTNEIEFTDL